VTMLRGNCFRGISAKASWTGGNAAPTFYGGRRRPQLFGGGKSKSI